MSDTNASKRQRLDSGHHHDNNNNASGSHPPPPIVVDMPRLTRFRGAPKFCDDVDELAFLLDLTHAAHSASQGFRSPPTFFQGSADLEGLKVALAAAEAASPLKVLRFAPQDGGDVYCYPPFIRKTLAPDFAVSAVRQFRVTFIAKDRKDPCFCGKHTLCINATWSAATKDAAVHGKVYISFGCYDHVLAGIKKKEGTAKKRDADGSEVYGEEAGAAGSLAKLNALIDATTSAPGALCIAKGVSCAPVPYPIPFVAAPVVIRDDRKVQAAALTGREKEWFALLRRVARVRYYQPWLQTLLAEHLNAHCITTLESSGSGILKVYWFSVDDANGQTFWTTSSLLITEHLYGKLTMLAKLYLSPMDADSIELALTLPCRVEKRRAKMTMAASMCDSADGNDKGFFTRLLRDKVSLITGDLFPDPPHFDCAFKDIHGVRSAVAQYKDAEHFCVVRFSTDNVDDIKVLRPDDTDPTNRPYIAKSATGGVLAINAIVPEGGFSPALQRSQPFRRAFADIFRIGFGRKKTARWIVHRLSAAEKATVEGIVVDTMSVDDSDSALASASTCGPSL